MHAFIAFQTVGKTDTVRIQKDISCFNVTHNEKVIKTQALSLESVLNEENVPISHVLAYFDPNAFVTEMLHIDEETYEELFGFLNSNSSNNVQHFSYPSSYENEHEMHFYLFECDS